MNVSDRIKIILVMLVSVLVMDQVTKKLADIYLKDAEVFYYLWDMLQIRYAENTGAWGGLGGNLPLWGRIMFLQVLPFAFLIGLFFYVVTRDEFGRGDLIAFGLILGGGLGNLIDRIFYGYVIDMLYIGIGQFGLPVSQWFADNLFQANWLSTLGTNIFNVADVAIMAGTIYILAIAIIKKPDAPKSDANRVLQEHARARHSGQKDSGLQKEP